MSIIIFITKIWKVFLNRLHPQRYLKESQQKYFWIIMEET